MSGVVFNSTTKANLLHHLNIKGGSHAKTLSLEELSLLFKEVELNLKFILNITDCSLHSFWPCGIVGCREDIHLSFITHDFTRQWMQRSDLFNLITKHLNTNSKLFIHGDDFDCVSPDAECATLESNIVALVLNINEFAQKSIAFNLIPHTQLDHAVHILLRCSQSIDTGHCCNHNHIATS